MAEVSNGNDNPLKDDFSDFLEHSLCGFITTDPAGIIIQANTRIAQWMASSSNEIIGKRFPDLLSIGGKIYYETHLAPLLRMRGFFDEVILELASGTGERLPVFVNAYERRNASGAALLVRLTIFKASDRRQYEQNLKQDRTDTEQNLISMQASLQREQAIAAVREQFVAVLGHDLRNPLSSIISAASLLSQMVSDLQVQHIIAIISRSGARMAELIDNIMDFARARLGSGIVVNPKPTETEPILQHVVDEIRSAWPGRLIETDFSITEPVNCDAPRIGQLVSNLLANALTHGAKDTPVILRAFHKDRYFELSVSNQGNVIHETAIEKLFQPFSREDTSPSKNGLGLGLFIAAEIARGHQATLNVVSNKDETRFTFKMITG